MENKYLYAVCTIGIWPAIHLGGVGFLICIVWFPTVVGILAIPAMIFDLFTPK